MPRPLSYICFVPFFIVRYTRTNPDGRDQDRTCSRLLRSSVLMVRYLLFQPLFASKLVYRFLGTQVFVVSSNLHCERSFEGERTLVLKTSETSVISEICTHYFEPALLLLYDLHCFLSSHFRGRGLPTEWLIGPRLERIVSRNFMVCHAQSVPYFSLFWFNPEGFRDGPLPSLFGNR